MDDEENGKSDGRFDDTLVGVVLSNGKNAKMYSRSGFLGPSFYNEEDDGNFAYWLRQNPESISDVMMMFHSYIIQNERFNSQREDYLSLEPCKVLTEEK